VSPALDYRAVGLARAAGLLPSPALSESGHRSVARCLMSTFTTSAISEWGIWRKVHYSHR